MVELPDAGGVRVLGNLVGDATEPFAIGDQVEAVFEDHDDAATPWGRWALLRAAWLGACWS